MFIIEYVILRHTLSILLPGIFITNGLRIYILIRLFDNLCSLVYFSNEVVQTRLTLKCSQRQAKLATYFDLFKWRDLADSLENTLHIMRESTSSI